MTSPKTEMKLPLRVDEHNFARILDADGQTVGLGSPSFGVGEDRAAYLVRCVNEREEMVEALREAMMFLLGQCPPGAQMAAWRRDEILAILALLEPKK